MAVRSVEDTPESFEPEVSDGDTQVVRHVLEPEEEAPPLIEGEEPADEPQGEAEFDEDDEDLQAAKELLGEVESEVDSKTEDEKKALGPLTEEETKTLDALLERQFGGKVKGDEIAQVVQWIRQKQLEEHTQVFNSVLLQAGAPQEKLAQINQDIAKFWKQLPPEKQAIADNADGLRMIYKLLDARNNYSGAARKPKGNKPVRSAAVVGESSQPTSATPKKFKTQAEAIQSLPPDEYQKLAATGAFDKLPIM